MGAQHDGKSQRQETNKGLTSEYDDILFLIEKRIVSLKETKATALQCGYGSLVADCDVRIKENELLITLIEEL